LKLFLNARICGQRSAKPVPGQDSDHSDQPYVLREQFVESWCLPHDRAEIMTVNFVKVWRIGVLIQIHIGSYDLAEIHPGFLEVVEQIAHGLPGLMLLVVP
jgi:hypothetical protein